VRAAEGAVLGGWTQEIVHGFQAVLGGGPTVATVIGEIGRQFALAGAETAGFAANIEALVTFARNALGALAQWVDGTFGGLADLVGGWFEGITYRASAMQALAKGQFEQARAYQATADAAFARLESGRNRFLYQGGYALKDLDTYWQQFNRTLDANRERYDAIAAAVNEQADASQRYLTARIAALTTQSTYQENEIDAFRRERSELTKLTDAAGDVSASFTDMGNSAEDAGTKAASAIASAIEKAQGFSIGLGEVGKGPLENWFKPGANGPFEKLYRLQDIAVRGAASPFGAQLGVDQATAQRIVEQWQQGLLTADVTQFIDEGKLVALLKLQQLAEASQQAFVNRMAALAGAGGAYAGQLLGAMFGGTDEKAQATAIAVAVTPVADRAVTSLETAFSAKKGDVSAVGKAVGDTLTGSLSNALGGAYEAGRSWIGQLAAGITAGLPALQAALQAVANLFPHSPAKAGPLRQAPNWRAYMMGGLNDAAAMVGQALGGGAGQPAAAYQPVYVSGDSFYVAINDQAAAGLLLAEMDARRRERVNRFMG
jgi:hypothetical protein